MPEIPQAVVRAAAEVMLRQYGSEHDASHLTWQDFEFAANEILEAAAPLLAEAWGVRRRPAGGTRDPRAGITCRRCGAQPGQMCITSSGSRAPMVHAERRNDARRAEGQTTRLEQEGANLDRFPPPAAPSVPAGTTEEGEQ
jgi:hypothetical protein